MTPSGTVSLFYTFCSKGGQSCTDGSEPYTAGLIQGTDGNFYGTTSSGGANTCSTGGCGTVFKITPRGTLTTLYNFCSQEDCLDGDGPIAGLVQGTDGNFYGTTVIGGGNGSIYGGGTVFKITPSGTLTTLYSFCLQTACADGLEPAAALVEGTDGNFYGTTEYGGNALCSGGCGTVFRITPGGTLTTLHSFDISDGANPEVALIQASDGNFYGTTPSNVGEVFKMTPSGTLTILYGFCQIDGCTDGFGPRGALVEGTDGNFYGTTFYGGFAFSGGFCNEGCGTAFRLTRAAG